MANKIYPENIETIRLVLRRELVNVQGQIMAFDIDPGWKERYYNEYVGLIKERDALKQTILNFDGHFAKEILAIENASRGNDLGCFLKNLDRSEAIARKSKFRIK